MLGFEVLFIYSHLGSVDSYAEGKAEEEDEPSGSLSVDTSCREIDTSDYESGSITPTTIGHSWSGPIDQSIFESEGWQTLCEYVNNKFTKTKEAVDRSIEEQNEKVLQTKAVLAAKVSELTGHATIQEIQSELKTIKECYTELEKADAKKVNLDKYKYTEEFYKVLSSDSVFVEQYRHRYSDEDAVEDAPLVTRYGICADKFSHLCGAMTLDVLHPVEFYILSKAVKHLLSQPAASSVSDDVVAYKNNVVLCDIFAREKGDDRSIKIDQKKSSSYNFPEVHTVALWQIADNEFILIDPNKEDFSKIIPVVEERPVTKEEAKSGKEKFRATRFDKLKFDTKLLFKVNVVSASSIDASFKQFYQKGNFDGLEGEGKTDLRDCIDIAVKIGFELNELQKGEGDAKEILSTAYNKMATSGSEYDSLKLLRGAHASGEDARSEFYNNTYLHGVNILQKSKKKPKGK